MPHYTSAGYAKIKCLDAETSMYVNIGDPWTARVYGHLASMQIKK